MPCAFCSGSGPHGGTVRSGADNQLREAGCLDFVVHSPVGGWSPEGRAQSRPPVGEPQFSRGGRMVSCVDRLLSADNTNCSVIEEVELAGAQAANSQCARALFSRPVFCLTGSCSILVDCPRKDTGGGSRKSRPVRRSTMRDRVGEEAAQRAAGDECQWRRFRGEGPSNRLTTRILSPSLTHYPAGGTHHDHQ